MSTTAETTWPRRVLVTGASSGLGRGLAEGFAARGADLVVVARRRDRLDDLADRLRRDHGTTVTVLTADLADPDAPRRLVAEIDDRGLDVDGLVNCAGFGTSGPFVEEDPQRVADEITVNALVPTLLTRLLLPRLLAAPAGVVLMVSSSAGAQPVPNFAVYAATKSYVTALTAALWQECRGSRLRVLALCPGPTDTEFAAIAGCEHFRVGPVASPDTVVRAAFAALAARRPVATIGLDPRLRTLSARIMPLRVTLRLCERATARPADQVATTGR